MFKGCNDCEKYYYKFSNSNKCPDGYVMLDQDEVLGNKYAICEAGFNKEMQQWWNKNGNELILNVEDMKCFVGMEIDKVLENINDMKQ